MDSNTCAGADTSLPEDFLDEIAKLVVKNKGGKWQGRVRKDSKGNPIPGSPNQQREFLDDHDCCLAEDIGGDRCKPGECCCGKALVYYDVDTKRHRPLP